MKQTFCFIPESNFSRPTYTISCTSPCGRSEFFPKIIRPLAVADGRTTNVSHDTIIVLRI